MFGFKKKSKKKSVIHDAFINYNSGAGLRSDKSQSGFFQYSALAENNIELEAAYAESWAAAKIIDIPVDDMFIFPRDTIGLSEDDNKKLEQFDTELGITEKIKSAIKAARLYGTAFMVLITDDDVLTSPLNLDSKIINLKNILVIDRFNASILEHDNDIATSNFNEPLIYQFTFNRIAPINVHYSRVIRIDGVKPLTTNKWNAGYNQDWGVSELVRCINAVTNEESISSSINYLLQESSVPILKCPDLKDALAGAPDALGGSPDDTVSPIDQLVGKINDLKSIYRTLYLDSEMDLSRLQVSFAQVPDLFDKYHARLSAAADIPQTRFFGRSPAGLNSTGDSDMHNYAIKVASTQERILTPIYDKLDKIIAKTIGINQEIDYKFRPLLDISDTQKALVQLQNAQRDQIYMANGVLNDDEIRQTLYDNDTYPDIDPEMKPIGVDEELRSNIISNLQNNSKEEEDSQNS